MAERTNRKRRSLGLSLLEVILAIAILGGSLAVVGELMRIGARSAATARDLTTAQILCESTLSEVAAGAIAPDPIDSAPADDTGEWLYSVQSEQIDQLGLLAVTVTVHQSPDVIARPVSFTLVRWVTDPAATPVDTAAGDSATASTAAAGSAATGGASGT